jgi:hypothetical protein
LCHPWVRAAKAKRVASDTNQNSLMMSGVSSESVNHKPGAKRAATERGDQMGNPCIVQDCNRTARRTGDCYFCEYHRASPAEIGRLRDDNKKLRERVAVLTDQVAPQPHRGSAARINELEDALMNAGLPF